MILVYHRGAFSIVKRCVRLNDSVHLAAKIVNIQKLSSRGETVCPYSINKPSTTRGYISRGL